MRLDEGSKGYSYKLAGVAPSSSLIGVCTKHTSRYVIESRIASFPTNRLKKPGSPYYIYMIKIFYIGLGNVPIHTACRKDKGFTALKTCKTFCP